MDQSTEIININTDFIRLDALLKFAAAAGSGGEAKMLILDGQVLLNGEICTQRTKKLRDGDVITINGESFLVRGEAK